MTKHKHNVSSNFWQTFRCTMYLVYGNLYNHYSYTSKLNGGLISKRKYNMLFKSINVFVSEKCLNLFIRNTVVVCRCIMKLMLSYSSWKLKSLCTVARYQSLLHLFPYLFICSFTYTCVCILIQALDKSLQRRTYYHFSIRLDFIFLGNSIYDYTNNNVMLLVS